MRTANGQDADLMCVHITRIKDPKGIPHAARHVDRGDGVEESGMRGSPAGALRAVPLETKRRSACDGGVCLTMPIRVQRMTSPTAAAAAAVYTTATVFLLLRPCSILLLSHASFLPIRACADDRCASINSAPRRPRASLPAAVRALRHCALPCAWPASLQRPPLEPRASRPPNTASRSAITTASVPPTLQPYRLVIITFYWDCSAPWAYLTLTSILPSYTGLTRVHVTPDRPPTPDSQSSPSDTPETLRSAYRNLPTTLPLYQPTCPPIRILA